jgi:hypothetical protein
MAGMLSAGRPAVPVRRPARPVHRTVFRRSRRVETAAYPGAMAEPPAGTEPETMGADDGGRWMEHSPEPYVGCLFDAVLVAWSTLVVFAGAGFLAFALDDCVAGCRGGRVRFAVLQPTGALLIAAAVATGLIAARRSATVTSRILRHGAAATVVLGVEGLVMWLVLLGVRL